MGKRWYRCIRPTNLGRGPGGSPTRDLRGDYLGLALLWPKHTGDIATTLRMLLKPVAVATWRLRPRSTRVRVRGRARGFECRPSDPPASWCRDDAGLWPIGTIVEVCRDVNWQSPLTLLPTVPSTLLRNRPLWPPGDTYMYLPTSAYRTLVDICYRGRTACST